MPHLKALVERHENDPFVLIGINTQDPPAAYSKGVKDFEVTWLSAYQGMEMSPISQLYSVQSYPTYLVIDPEGNIVLRDGDKNKLDAVVKDLIAKAKAK